MYSTLASLKSCGQKKSCPKYSLPTMKYLPAVKYPLTMMHLVLCKSRPSPHLRVSSPRLDYLMKVCNTLARYSETPKVRNLRNRFRG